MIIKTLEDRKYVVPTPAGKAELPPVIVVRRLPTHRNHRIDSRRAAYHLSSRVFKRASVEACLFLCFEHPIRAWISDGKKIAYRNMKPDPVVFSACFQNQNAVLGICREPVGDDTARRSGSNNNVVVVASQFDFGGHDKLLNATARPRPDLVRDSQRRLAIA